MIGILHLAKSVMFLVHFLTGFLNAHAEYMHRSSKANVLLLFETSCTLRMKCTTCHCLTVIFCLNPMGIDYHL